VGIPDPLERDVQAVCIEWLEFWGAVVIRTNSGAMKIDDRFIRFNSKKGCSDTIVCLPGGRYLALELKRPGRDRTSAKRKAEQAAFRQSIARAGGLAIVAKSLDELKQDLRDEGYDTETRQ
jgi:hypothetical protein